MSYLDDIGHGYFDGSYLHAVAVTNDNTVLTAGNSNYLGAIANETNVAKVACGYYQSFAVLIDGTVKAYGANSNSVVSTAGTLENVNRIFATKINYIAVFALHNDGSLTAFGYNTYNVSSGLNGLTNVVHVGSGRYNAACVHGDGTVSWSGYDASISTSGIDSVTDAVMVACVNYAIVVLHSDRTLSIFGAANGQQELVSEAAAITGAIYIEAISESSIVVGLDDGSVVVIGADYNGADAGAAEIAGAVRVVGGVNPPIIAQFADGSLQAFGTYLPGVYESIAAWSDVPQEDPTYYMSGITALSDGTPVSAEITVLKDDTKTVLYSVASSPVDGSWSVIMPRRWNAYVMAIYDNGYQPQVHGPITAPPEV